MRKGSLRRRPQPVVVGGISPVDSLGDMTSKARHQRVMAGLPAVAPADVKRWAEQIRTHVGATLESIFETGRALTACRAELGSEGHRQAVLASGMSLPAASKLEQIAQCRWFTRISPVKLPTGYSTLYTLARIERLSPGSLSRALAAGHIDPMMTRHDAEKLRPKTPKSPGPFGGLFADLDKAIREEEAKTIPAVKRA